MKKQIGKSFLKFVPFAVAITLVYGAIYAVVQQTYRQGADDPQVQYVQDIKEILESGQAGPQDIAGQNKVDASKSLATFIIVFDKDKKAVASSAILDNAIPLPPNGSFDDRKNQFFNLFLRTSENRFTWSPKKDVRIAAVLTKYKDGYVLAGRSLKEVENRVIRLGLTVLIACVVTLATTLVSIGLIGYLKSKPKKP